MPRNYKRQTNRQSWSQVSMAKAIEAVRENKMGWLLASKTFGVPQATLRRHALNTNKSLEPIAKGLGRFKLTFPAEIERQLVEHLKLLETRLFGLTRRSVQELAFELAEKNGFPHCFNREKKRAGQEWLEGFLSRNKDISLRTPEHTSAARAQAFNKPQVTKFFQLYQDSLNTHKFGPHRIFNVDETGLTTVQKPQKILATKGRKQIGCLTSAERGSNITVVCCTNAIGSYIPPCMIFPRKNMKEELVDDAPTGTLGLAQESGWMNTEVFVRWLRHFQAYTKSSNEDPVLLICDGHASHKGIEPVTYAKENGIHMLCLPPHCTHRMQPLDVSIYGPLKTYFHQEISKWLKNHPGRVVTHLQMGYLLNQAYGKTATVQNACNGFKSTGLWPVNPDIFPDYMFEPAETTNIPLNSENIEHTISNANDVRLSPSREFTATTDIVNVSLNTGITVTTNSNALLASNDNETINTEPGSLVEDVPTADSTSVLLIQENPSNGIAETIPCGGDTSANTAANMEVRPSTSMASLPFPIDALSPAPQGPFIPGQGKRKPKAQKSHWLLTSTPNMEELKAKNAPKSPPVKKKRQVKKMLFEEDTENRQTKNIPNKRPRVKRGRKIDMDYKSDSSDEDFPIDTVDDDEDCPCIYCNDLFSRSKPGECWLRCVSCSSWAHASCADVPKKTKNFICELCI